MNETAKIKQFISFDGGKTIINQEDVFKPKYPTTIFKQILMEENEKILLQGKFKDIHLIEIEVSVKVNVKNKDFGIATYENIDGVFKGVEMSGIVTRTKNEDAQIIYLFTIKSDNEIKIVLWGDVDILWYNYKNQSKINK